ncbi:hypothetical protein RhiirC2_779775 [Rhizophagus irregularis]|uniref:FAD-binding domain-containing protein n=1 Tax=Rhizophagus irregularis TaxID=588596 RepID=A0A2N1N8X8_9GLOM|nr:hypothetical protein RhiirC2_779775 [Rhizophagus irregularis]
MQNPIPDLEFHEDVPVQWSKKCVGYEETKEGVLVFFKDRSREFCDILVGADGVNSPVRKQKLHELQIFDYGVTLINAEVAVPKKQGQNYKPHYRTSISISYPTKFDNVEKIKHNNQTPAFERFLVLIIRDLTPKITLDLEKYPLINKTYNPVQRRDINPLSVNIWKRMKNALKDAEIFFQALINYSSENYISCI